MHTDNRFENLLAGLTPVLDEVVPPKKEGNDVLAKRTYVIAEVIALVCFPAGIVFTDMPATEDKPAYGYGTVSGTHIHLVEGATAQMIVDGAVKVQTRVRTVEPTVDREGARKNYEIVLRIAPNVDEESATKQIWVDPADNFHKTVVNPHRGILIHKGADLLIQDYDAKEAMIAEQIAAAAQ